MAQQNGPAVARVVIELSLSPSLLPEDQQQNAYFLVAGAADVVTALATNIVRATPLHPAIDARVSTNKPDVSGNLQEGL